MQPTGTGYRIQGGEVRRTSSLDINLGADIGKVTDAELRVGNKIYAGEVSNATIHVVASLSLIAHFSL
jgi:hypothetical protein